MVCLRIIFFWNSVTNIVALFWLLNQGLELNCGNKNPDRTQSLPVCPGLFGKYIKVHIYI